MLFEQIKKDRITYFKQRNENMNAKVGYNVLGVLIGDATKETKEPNDEKIIALLKKFIDNAKVCIENARDDLSRLTAEKEIEVLSQYLPQQLSESDIKTLIANMVVATDDINIGMIMKFFKNNYAGQYDGALVSAIEKKLFRFYGAIMLVISRLAVTRLTKV